MNSKSSSSAKKKTLRHKYVAPVPAKSREKYPNIKEFEITLVVMLQGKVVDCAGSIGALQHRLTWDPILYSILIRDNETEELILEANGSHDTFLKDVKRTHLLEWAFDVDGCQDLMKRFGYTLATYFRKVNPALDIDLSTYWLALCTGLPLAAFSLRKRKLREPLPIKMKNILSMQETGEYWLRLLEARKLIKEYPEDAKQKILEQPLSYLEELKLPTEDTKAFMDAIPNFIEKYLFEIDENENENRLETDLIDSFE